MIPEIQTPGKRRGIRWAELVGEFRQGAKTLMLHKLRSLLTMLGVVFGVGSVIAMLAVGAGANKEALERIRRLGSRNIILSTVKPAQNPAEATHPGAAFFHGLTEADLERIRESIPGISRVLRVRHHRKEASSGTITGEYRIVGVEDGWFGMFDQRIVAGRALDARDDAQSAAVCVLTESAAASLLPGRDPLGVKVRVNRGYYEVVGLVTSSGSSAAGGIETPNQADDIYVPFSTSKIRYGNFRTSRAAGSVHRTHVELDQIIVEASPDADVVAVAGAVEEVVGKFHTLGDFAVSVPLTLQRQAEATQRTFSVVLGSIAGISLLVGGIGIMNIMLASVTERTREIGIRRAIGAKRRQIVRQFLIETVTLSLLGGAVGVAFGLAVPYLIERFSGMPTAVTFTSVILSLGISSGIGVVFGLYPAVKAANLDPIAALRHQ